MLDKESEYEKKTKILVLDMLYFKFPRKKASWDVKQGYLDLELKTKGKGWK